ncbi:MAG: hypothetical protein ACFFDN_36000 [Candidatus Hodarchaeota archaeon]
MKTDKKVLKVFFALFLFFVIVLPVMSVFGYYDEVDLDIPLKQKGDQWNNVNHGSSDNYITIYYEYSGGEFQRARIKYLKLNWGTFAHAFPLGLPSILYWLKNEITLKVGSNSQTWTYTDFSDPGDKNPYSHNDIRYMSWSSWVYGPGDIEVTIKTEIYYKAWHVIYWAYHYKSVTTELSV